MAVLQQDSSYMVNKPTTETQSAQRKYLNDILFIFLLVSILCELCASVVNDLLDDDPVPDEKVRSPR